MDKKQIRRRLDALLDEWTKASPQRRLQLVLEKIRLEEALEADKR